VKVWEDGDRLFFEVADTGAGFDMKGAAGKGAGFVNMSDRVGAVGGTMNVDSALGTGTTISGRVPITVPAQPKIPVS
jgi:signal transduction histidine kinase